ncbi:MAG: DinB family protein [Candidatus Sifarchaeia archaeon]
MISCIEMLLNHNIACRELLLQALEQLSIDAFVKDLGISRGSIRNVLAHLVNTERYWISVLDDSELEYIEPKSLNDVQSIRTIWSKIHEKTRDFVANINDVQLHHVKSVSWENQTVSFTVAKALLHMINHETHHRGLLAGLMRLEGIEPPDFNML